MGFQEISLKLPPEYEEPQLRSQIAKELKLREFSYQIEQKSLDARKKGDIHWLLRLTVLSPELGGAPPAPAPLLEIPPAPPGATALVAGSGPAGFFAAYLLQQAGVEVTLIERGAEVRKRAAAIRAFEGSGRFDPLGNYAFGEGGAGTFSDGKLTSRTKNISREKNFILQSYIEAGAPPEIAYLAHPHLGSDNLKKIVRNLRQAFIRLGGTIHFETQLTGLAVEKGRVTGALTPAGSMSAGHYLIAPGHSAHDTTRMLIASGVQFRAKNFALGCRVEHPQATINLAQWGRERLPGVKAAEYRLTSKGDGILPVYTFCMCPGGEVVAAAALAETNIVNGMSDYARGGEFANAACVAGVNLPALLGRELTALEVLDWLGNLEGEFYRYGNSYQAPYCRIADFIQGRESRGTVASSYRLGLQAAPLSGLLPAPVSRALSAGLREFGRKIRGFEQGIILGLESKTSSPVQAVLDGDGRCQGFANLYLAGEGSGYAGGIISSASNGIKAALRILAGRG